MASPAPADVPALQAWFEDEVLAAPRATAPWLERAVQAFEKQLGLEQQMPAEGMDAGDDAAGKLALARAIGLGERVDGTPGDGMQRIVSERLEARLHKRWGAVHVRSRVAQVAEIEAQVADARTQVEQAHEALAADVDARLWIPATSVQRWLARHAAVLAMLDGFATRLAAARAGFAALPVDEGAAERAPPPVVFEESDAAAAAG